MLWALCCLCCAAVLGAQDAERDVLRYGTDNEISELIKTLKNDKRDGLDNDLVELVRITKNPAIKSQIIGFFASREKAGLENDAISLIENNEDVESVNVLAAIDYVGKIKYSAAQQSLRELVEAGEERYLNAAIRAIGMANNEASADASAAYLIEYYETKNPLEETQRQIVEALGETRSKKTTEFLTGIISQNERPVLTMTALAAVAKINDDSALDTVSTAAASKDPNVRAAAVEALGSFPGSDADKTILDAFRDSHYKTRLAAVKAAGTRKLNDAVPYLKFRAEKDQVPAVQDEAARSLGAIGSAECSDILEKLFDEKKTSDRLKIICAEMLLAINADRYAEKIIAVFQEAKRLNQRPLSNGLITTFGKVKTDRVRPLVERLFASKEAGDKAWALELTAQNKFTNFLPEVQRLASEQNSGIARKAREVQEKLSQ
jgi:HEAT repeat protein